MIATKLGQTAAKREPRNRNVGDAGAAIRNWEMSDELTLKNVTS